VLCSTPLCSPEFGLSYTCLNIQGSSEQKCIWLEYRYMMSSYASVCLKTRGGTLNLLNISLAVRGGRCNQPLNSLDPLSALGGAGVLSRIRSARTKRGCREDEDEVGHCGAQGYGTGLFIYPPRYLRYRPRKVMPYTTCRPWWCCFNNGVTSCYVHITSHHHAQTPMAVPAKVTARYWTKYMFSVDPS